MPGRVSIALFLAGDGRRSRDRATRMRSSWYSCHGVRWAAACGDGAVGLESGLTGVRLMSGSWYSCHGVRWDAACGAPARSVSELRASAPGGCGPRGTRSRRQTIPSFPTCSDSLPPGNSAARNNEPSGGVRPPREKRQARCAGQSLYLSRTIQRVASFPNDTKKADSDRTGEFGRSPLSMRSVLPRQKGRSSGSSAGTAGAAGCCCAGCA